MNWSFTFWKNIHFNFQAIHVYPSHSFRPSETARLKARTKTDFMALITLATKFSTATFTMNDVTRTQSSETATFWRPTIHLLVKIRPFLGMLIKTYATVLNLPPTHFVTIWVHTIGQIVTHLVPELSLTRMSAPARCLGIK